MEGLELSLDSTCKACVPTAYCQTLIAKSTKAACFFVQAPFSPALLPLPTQQLSMACLHPSVLEAVTRGVETVVGCLQQWRKRWPQQRRWGGRVPAAPLGAPHTEAGAWLPAHCAPARVPLAADLLLPGTPVHLRQMLLQAGACLGTRLCGCIHATSVPCHALVYLWRHARCSGLCGGKYEFIFSANICLLAGRKPVYNPIAAQWSVDVTLL